MQTPLFGIFCKAFSRVKHFIFLYCSSFVGCLRRYLCFTQARRKAGSVAVPLLADAVSKPINKMLAHSAIMVNFFLEMNAISWLSAGVHRRAPYAALAAAGSGRSGRL